MSRYANVALLFACATHLPASILYNVTDLTETASGVPTGALVTGSAINNSGQIAGFLSFFRLGSMGSAAMLYTAGNVTLINPPDTNSSRATGINDSGDVVGTTEGAGVFRHSGGQTTFLGTLGAKGTFPQAALTDINNRGEASGCASIQIGNAGGCRALVLSDGQIRDLGSLAGTFSVASAINDSGQVTGASSTAGGPMHAFLYQNGVMTDLGDLGGLGSSGAAINNRGQIAGTSPLPGFFDHAFLYDNGVMKDLGTLAEGGRSNAHGINDNGQVVGEDSAGAFLYTDGQMFDLNSLIDASLGIRLFSADAINDFGVIVARGVSAGTVPYNASFILTPLEAAPVPEPSAFAITGTGISGIIVLAVLRARSRERFRSGTRGQRNSGTGHRLPFGEDVSRLCITRLSSGRIA